MTHKLSFYVPETDLETVKTALFNAGAGKIGQYDHCAWQTKGTGQFRPLNNSNPSIGETNQLTSLIEYQVEMVIDDDKIPNVIKALHTSHPYETPAYALWKLLDEHP